LQQNLFFFFIIVSGSVAGLYLYVTHNNRLYERNDSINDETKRFQEVVFMEREYMETENQKKNDRVALIANSVHENIAHVKTSFEFMTKNNELITAEVRKKYEDILLNALNLSLEMIDNLRNFDAFDTPQKSFKRSFYALGEMIQEAVNQIKQIADQKSLKLKLLPVDHLVFVDYDTFFTALRLLLQLSIQLSLKGKFLNIHFSSNTPTFTIELSGKGQANELKNLERFIFNEYHLLPELSTQASIPSINYLFCYGLILRNAGNLAFISDLGGEFKFIISLPVKI
jgi:light-regulated signal transduction histidine kinase (bacteriophytochrome)